MLETQDLLSTQQSHPEKCTYTFKKQFARSLQEHQTFFDWADEFYL